MAHTSLNDDKFQMQIDQDRENEDQDQLIKSGRLRERRQQIPFRWTSLVLPSLLGLLLLIGTILLILTITRRNTCLRQQVEQTEAILGYIPDADTKTWLPCVKTSHGACVCPATFIHSKVNPKHCIPNHSRCLLSCKHNQHCSCHNLVDADRCRSVTQNWIENELKIQPMERFRLPKVNELLQYTWTDHFSQQLERLLVDKRAGERLFLSPNRRTGIAVHEQDDDYLLNERWTKVEINTTRTHITYTQLNPQTHSCRMSLLRDDGSVTHGPVHTCPGSPLGAPYFLGAACNDVLVLWHGAKQFRVRRQEGWTQARHHFEATVPRLPILFDPFHRYYSLYQDSMIEIKDLNGDVLGQFFTTITRANRFEFFDHLGTIFVANSTHMQKIQVGNETAWLDY